MSSKLGLYTRTVLGLMPSQIRSRLRRMVNLDTPLPGATVNEVLAGLPSRLSAVPELDFDPVFLARYDCEGILSDRVEILHHAEDVDWSSSWFGPHVSRLWSFNLHYFEYLLPLLHKTVEGCGARYVEKANDIVRSWIVSCPRSAGGDAWHPYTISVRVTNWLAFIAEGGDLVASDTSFMEELDLALAAQYAYLSRHLETDLMANHYFENLKALVLLAVYFEDEAVLEVALDLLEGQVGEQVLADGMHFELSPMYHKIVLEGLLRVIATLQVIGIERPVLEDAARKMCDALYSLERNTNRTPLFNDSGDNVAKSCDALLACAKRLLNYKPIASLDLSVSGYHIIERDCPIGKVKLILDAGLPGPRYAPGHAHCDALSFELFINGIPAVVNSGTYAYQDPLRSWFRGSAAHNGVWCEGVEQSEMWGEHRMARNASARLVSRVDSEVSSNLTAEMIDCRGAKIVRTISVDNDELLLCDNVLDMSPLNAALHFPCYGGTPYAPEFGRIERATSFEVSSLEGGHSIRIPLKQLANGKPVISVSYSKEGANE